MSKKIKTITDNTVKVHFTIFLLGAVGLTILNSFTSYLSGAEIVQYFVGFLAGSLILIFIS